MINTSIIIPTFFTPLHYVDQCLYSVVRQDCNLEELEVIIFDDGSSSDYQVQLEQLASKYASSVDMQIDGTNCNRGPGFARNQGAALARGKFLVLVDSDDQLHPSAVKKCLAKFTAEIDLVYTNSISWAETSGIVTRIREKSIYHKLHLGYKHTIFDPLLHATFVFHVRCVRRSAFREVGGFAEDVLAENIDFNIRIAEAAEHINYGFVAEPLCYHRENKDSLTANSQFNSELTASTEMVLVMAARRQGFDVTTATRLCREPSTGTTHYLLTGERGIIRTPYFDYQTQRIRIVSSDPDGLYLS